MSDICPHCGRTAASQDARPGADAVALADALEARWDANETESNPLANGKMIRIGYGELDKITAALRAQPSPGVLTSFDAGGKAREALEEDESSLEVPPELAEWDRENRREDRAALAAPQPQAERVLRHHANETLEESEYLRAQSQAGASEPVAWLVLAKDRNNTRIWWQDKERAEAWSAQHNLPLIPLYAAPLPAASILALSTPSPTAAGREKA